MTVEIERWMDDELEARQKKSGSSKRWQVNKALEFYLEKKTVAKSV
jgi:hypothetical protein